MTQTYKLSPWDLSDLLAGTDDETVNAAVAQMENAVQAVEALRESLSADMVMADFSAALQKLEHATREAYKLNAYADLWFSADTQSQDALSFKGRIDQLLLDMQNRTLFFSLWWKSLDDEDAARLIEGAGDLRYYLQKMRNFKPYTLSEAEEKIINSKDVNGIDAVVTLYDMITNKFKFTLTVDGEEKTMTREELMIYARNPDPALRQAAYDEMYRVYSEEGTLLSQVYNYRVRDWANEQVNLRKFASPIAVRNLVNDLPDAVVDTLLDVVSEEAHVFHRYFKLKAKWLGMPKLRRYDIYAPLSKSTKKTDFDDAVKMVLDTFDAFSPEVGQHARRVFEDRHIDSEVRAGKRGGAFCASILPEQSPYVLVNYTGEVRDVATLAHEMGHAIHAMLASHHNIFTFHSSLPLAETASTFGEMMLVDQLLANEPDESVRRDLLFRQVDDSYATIMRQAYFALFERKAHQMVKENASVDELAAAYMENLKTQFGDSLEVSDEFKWEWVSIPHIYHTPFYVYAYAFGQLLVLSLYKQYKAEGEAFKPRYLKLLSAGGSQAPEKILSEAGINIRSAEFWQGGFDVIKDLVTQLEALPIE